MELRDVAIVAGGTTLVIGIAYLGYKAFTKKNEGDDKFFEDISSKAKTVANDAYDWVKENPEKATMIFTAGAAAVNFAKDASVKYQRNSERNRIDRTYYDPRTGFHWKLVRTPTNNDRMIIAARQKLGEDTGKILRDLRLI